MIWHVLFPEDFQEDILERHFTEPSRQSHISSDLHPQADLPLPGQVPLDIPVLLTAVEGCGPARRPMGLE